MTSCPKSFLVFVTFLVTFVLTLCAGSSAQISHSEQVQITPPLIRTVDPPAPDATVADLESRADQLRSSKLYPDALKMRTRLLQARWKAERLRAGQQN